MNYEQVKGAGDRVVAVLVGIALTWALQRGYLGEKDVAALALALPIIITFAIGMWVNRRASIAESASNLGDVVISTQEIADATPNNSRVISHNSPTKEIVAVVADAKAEEVRKEDKKNC